MSNVASSLTWTELKSNGQRNEKFFQAPVKGGWLVMCRWDSATGGGPSGPGITLAFVPDTSGAPPVP